MAGGSQLLQEFIVHQIDIPEDLEDVDGSSASLALVVLRRRTGALLALPFGVLSPETLAAELETTSEDQVGMSTHVSVPAGAVQDLGATDLPQGAGDVLLDLVLVDVPNSFLDTLVPFAESTVPFEVVHPFSFDDPLKVPMPEDLVRLTWEWIQDPGSAQLVTYYSAEEGEAVPETPSKRSKSRRCSKESRSGPAGPDLGTDDCISALGDDPIRAAQQKTGADGGPLSQGSLKAMSIAAASWSLNYSWIVGSLTHSG